ncbi:MAG: hypothetical protein ABS76_38970 [Pelagibacterium sp. SCN 64-44]|nr:MAG: hypothetical protein ABS76_38970 [Pelagibacterium sp. SCN 64-44]
MSTGRIDLAPKDRSRAGELAATTLVGGATIVLLGSFVPLPDLVGLELMKHAVGTAGGGAAAALVARESKWFAQRQNDKLASSNQATIAAALDHMAAITKISSRHGRAPN